MLRVALITLKGGSGSDVYYRLLKKALSPLTSVHSDLFFLPSWLTYFPFLIPVYIKKMALAQYDIIHTNSEYGHFFRIDNKIIVNTIHHNVFDPNYRGYTSLPEKIFHRFWVRPNLKKSLNTADVTIAVSNYTRDSIRSYFDTGQNSVQTIYNCIDTKVFRRIKRMKENDNRKIRLLFVGNISRRKGFDLLPRIMRKLGNEYELYFTSGLKSTESITKKYSLPSNMFPLHRLSEEELVGEYNRCDGLLFPSRLEGFGYCVAEALACGSPVITTNCSAMPELVRNGYNGFLCRKDDVDDFVGKIRMLRQLDSGDIYEGAYKRFNLCKYAREMESLYRGLFDSES